MNTKDVLALALEEAATSLETLSRLAGKKTFIDEEGTRQETCLEDFTQVRGYANSRALIAREALKQAQEPVEARSLFDRANDLHDKAAMPWTEAEKLALSEQGIDDAQIEELIHEHASTILVEFTKGWEDLQEYTRALLVHAVTHPAPKQAQAQEPVTRCGGRGYCDRMPFCGCGGPEGLPERDSTKPAEAQGLFRKFIVQRVDGSDKQGGKHYGCEYFVLDVDHDPHAKAALRAYAQACAESHPQLSADLIAKHGPAPKQAQEPVNCGCCNGTGWVVRDPDIGTDQECFCCNGSGKAETEPAPKQAEPAEKRKLYECTGCGHLHEEKPSSCDCCENPANDYNDWMASPTPPEAKA
jgi:hypothetical protein